MIPDIPVRKRKPTIHMIFSERSILSDLLTSAIALKMKMIPAIKLKIKQTSAPGLCSMGSVYATIAAQIETKRLIFRTVVFSI